MVNVETLTDVTDKTIDLTDQIISVLEQDGDSESLIKEARKLGLGYIGLKKQIE